MAKYRVQVFRTGYRQATVEVQAETMDQALKEALEAAGDEIFGDEYDVYYSVGNAEIIEEKQNELKEGGKDGENVSEVHV